MMKSGWLIYSGIMFVLFVVSIFVSRYPIANGFMPLRKLRGNSDTPVSVASLAVAVQSIISLFMPNVFLDETYHIYVPLLILSLLLNSLGKLLIIRRTADNFRFLCSKEARFAGKIYTKTENADRIVSGLPSRKPIIAYCKRSKFMSNFLQLSYAADPVEELSAFFAPIAAGVSVLCAIIYGIMTKDFASGVCSFALSACITIPMCSLLAINIPMLNLCSSANKSGAMVVGYEAVKQFCDTNAVMVDSNDLYPEGCVKLDGIKTFANHRTDESVLAAAAVLKEAKSPMAAVFNRTMISGEHGIKLPEVESVLYEDGMGLVGRVDGERILVGNRTLMHKYNIETPSEDYEEKYLIEGRQITYLAQAGELISMFVTTYTPDPDIADALRRGEQSELCYLIHTTDCNITADLVCEDFGLFYRTVKILPTGLGNVCKEAQSQVEEKSRAYLGTRGKLASMIRGVAGCVSIKSNISLAIVIQLIAMILGLLLVSALVLYATTAVLGTMQILIYALFWAVAALISPLIWRN